MADALIIVDYQNDFARPDGALSVPAGEEVAPHINELAASGDYELVVATRDWHPPDHGSFTEQGGIWPVHCVQGSDGAELHPALDTGPVDAIVDKGQDPGTEGYSAFDATGAGGDAARPRRRPRHGRRAGDGLLREEHRARRPPRGLRGDGGSRGRPRRRRRAGRLRARPRGAGGGGCDRGVGQPRRTTRASGCSRGCGRTSRTSACSPPCGPCRATASSRTTWPRRRGTTSRCRSAPGRRSPSRWWSRGCASCWRSTAASACSTSAPARATTPPCSRSSTEHVWSIERHPELSRLAGETLAAAGVENVTLVIGDGAAGHAEAAPYDAINVAAAMPVVPRALLRPARRRRAARRPGQHDRPAARAAAAGARGPRALRPRARALRAADHQPLTHASGGRPEGSPSGRG